MAFAPRLDLRQSQALVMTPQLRQAIQLLQYSNLEASQFIEDELLKNPLLERAETGEAVGEPEPPAPAPHRFHPRPRSPKPSEPLSVTATVSSSLMKPRRG